MGNIRRIKKQLAQPIAMADAHVDVNGCRVFLGHPNEGKALASAKGFKEMLTKTIMRSRCPNLSDLYGAHLRVLEKIKSGESIWN